MAQRFKPDVVGVLSHNAGTITLAASRLTVGGQQYSTSALQLVLSGLTAHATYMLYVVVNAGVASLVSSTNVNSVGPAGQTSWKLVGAFMANETPAWGSFLNIEGVPRTLTNMTYSASSTGFGTLSSPNFNVQRDGRWLVGDFRFTTGTVVGSTARIGFPTNLAVDTGILAQTSYYIGTMLNNSSVGFTQMLILNGQSLTDIYFQNSTTLGNTGILGNTSPFASGQVQSGQFRIPINGWVNTPLKDL